MENQEDKLTLLTTIFGNDITQSVIATTLRDSENQFDPAMEKLLTLPSNKPPTPLLPPHQLPPHLQAHIPANSHQQPQAPQSEGQARENIQRLHNMFGDLSQSIITTVYNESKGDVEGTVDTLLNFASNEVANAGGNAGGNVSREEEIRRQEQEIRNYEEYKRLQQALQENERKATEAAQRAALKENEERRKVEEENRKKVEEENRRKAGEESKRKAEHQQALLEQERLLREFQLKKAEDERVKRESEAKLKGEKIAQEERKRALEEEKKRIEVEKKRVEEEKRALEAEKRAVEEKKKKQQDEQRRVKLEEERKGLEEERKRMEEEKKRMEEKKRVEEGQKIAMKRLEEEREQLLRQRNLAEAERKILETRVKEEAIREVEERKKVEEIEKKFREEQERIRLSWEEKMKKLENEKRVEEARRQEEEAKRVEMKKLEEEERHRQEADMKRILELERMKLDEQRKRSEEEKRNAEERLKAMEIAARKRDEEEEERKRMEAEKKRQEEEERKREEEERARLLEEEIMTREREERERVDRVREEIAREEEMMKNLAQEQFAESAILVSPEIDEPRVQILAEVEGTEIRGTWTLLQGALPSPQSWLGLFPKRSINTYTGFMYVSGKAGEFQFKGLTPGHYEVRLFANKLVTSRIAESLPMLVGPAVSSFSAQLQGDQIMMEYKLDPPSVPSSWDWVGIYEKSQRRNKVYINSVYGNPTGAISVLLPRAPGSYEARLFAAGSKYNEQAAVDFVVEDNDCVSGELNESGVIKARWILRTVEGTTSDWIGLFSAGEPSSKYLACVYTNSMPHGEIDIPLPKDITPGVYELRLFSSKLGKYTTHKTSGIITVN